jgi:hypothetical protein
MEVEGWLFPRASFVGLQITVEDSSGVIHGPSPADVEQKRRGKAARDICIDGLKVLAFMAMADNDVTPQEVNVEHYYIHARLGMTGIGDDGYLIDDMLALAQGLSVTKHSLTRAVNRIATDREHYGLILNAALQLVNLGPDSSGVRVEALQRLKKAGKAKGWI